MFHLEANSNCGLEGIQNGTKHSSNPVRPSTSLEKAVRVLENNSQIKAIDKSISKVEDAIMKALESTPPELAADIYKTGLYLTGGGALLRGLDKRLSQKTKLPVHIAEDPLRAVVRGTGIALKNTHRFSFLIDRKSV